MSQNISHSTKNIFDFTSAFGSTILYFNIYFDYTKYLMCLIYYDLLSILMLQCLAPIWCCFFQTPTPAPITSVVMIKIISVNLSHFFNEKCYITTIPSYIFFLQYLAKYNMIEVLLLSKLFAKQFSFFICFNSVWFHTLVGIIWNNILLNIASNTRPANLF